MIDYLEKRTLWSAWFVSLQGHDSSPGSLALPFATIQHAADIAHPGDTVYIEGGVYHQSVVPHHSGTASAPITFEPYNGQSVTIDGADVMSPLTRTSPGVFTGWVSGDLGEGNDQFYINGIALNEATWPVTGANSSSAMRQPAKAYATKATLGPTVNGLATATLTIPSLKDPAGAWVGATIHVAPGQAWVYQTGKVIASKPGSITYSYVPLVPYRSQMPRAGTPFYLTGVAAAFNDGGTWYVNPKTGQFSLHYSGTVAPTVEMKHRLYAFDLSGDTYIRIENLNLFGCTINTNAGSSHITITGLNAKYLSEATNLPNPWDDQNHPHTTGIILNGTYNTIASSIIAFSSGDGVFLGGSNNTVENCVIHDVNLAAGDEAAVTTLGAYEQVLDNTIYNCARSGVVIRFSPHLSVLHNLIYNLAQGNITDCGGIYSWGTDGEGSHLAYNVIYNVRTGGYGGTGLYLDAGCYNYTLDHNVVWNAENAVKIDPPDGNIQLYNNTLLGTKFSIATQGQPVSKTDVFINDILFGYNQMGAGAKQSHNLINSKASLFVDAATHDYQLRKGSPAINAGQYIAGYTAIPKDRTFPDIGAYQYGIAPFYVGSSL